jgi:phenylalanine-4-hydroxylase
LRHSLESPQVQRYPARIEWLVNQSFEIDHYQPLLFVVEGFDQLFDMVGELEQWVREGRLNNVAPGEPAVAEADLRSFLNATLS